MSTTPVAQPACPPSMFEPPADAQEVEVAEVEKHPDGSVAFKDKDGNVVFKTPSKAEIAEAHTAAKKLIDKARAFIVLDHPFFASIMLKRPMNSRLDIPTLAVTDTGYIYYNPFFIKTLTVEQVVWAICHEVLHYASGHGIRRQQRDPWKWNIAGDRWINDTLNRSTIGQKIEGCEDVPGSADDTVENIYAQMPDPPKSKKGGKGKGSPDPLAGDMESDGEMSESEKSEIDAQRKIEVSEAAANAKMRGKLPGALAEFASKTVESRVPWFDILERHMTEKVKNDYSWARPNRRYMPDFYLPVVDGVGAMGEIVCQVDISGSVSRKEIEYYNGHLKRIVEQCRPSKVHVIYTDTHVQKHEVFENPEDLEIRFYSGGGTHMPAGMRWVEEQGIEPVVFITLTDGYTGWDSEPDFPTIHCISSDQKAPYGENVHFSLND